jgi:hypothetical protein
MEMPGFTICRHYMNHLLVCVISLFGSQVVFEKTVSGNEPEIIVDTSDVADHIQVLADDAFEGREGGRRGGRAASSYIEQEIMPLGLVPAGAEKSYFQSFPTRFGTLRNVLIMIPGSDPVLQSEMIVVGAHYDHVGYGNKRNSFGPFGYVHNGADDNASGVAGLIKIAETLAELSDPCRRTILLAFWDGEEQGLLGSKYFIKNPPDCIQDKKIIFSINLDMIGRLRRKQLNVFGARSATGLETLVTHANNRREKESLELIFNWDITPDSDHYPFLKAEVPTLMFHTGLHPDYHRPSDDAHLINIEGIEPVLEVTLQTLLQVANNADDTFAFRETAFHESNKSRKKLEEKAFLPIGSRGRWGIGIRDDPANPAAPVVVAIRKESPAERGGLQIKDRIYAMDDTPIIDQKDFMRRLSEVSHNDGISILVSRRGQFLELTWAE